jgi:hypothetical protein
LPFRWDKLLAREKRKALEQPKATASLSSNKAAAKGKGSAGPSSSGGGGGGATAGGKSGIGQQRPPPARFNGLSVCFGFNTPAGCTRTKHNQNACVDSVNAGTIYAHVCNWYNRPAAGHQGAGSYCLATHPRHLGGH